MIIIIIIINIIVIIIAPAIHAPIPNKSKYYISTRISPFPSEPFYKTPHIMFPKLNQHGKGNQIGGYCSVSSHASFKEAKIPLGRQTLSRQKMQMVLRING